MKKLLVTSLLACSFLSVCAQQINPLIDKDDFENQKKWVDSIYGKMSLQEKVGQLFMTVVFSSDPSSTTNKTKELIRDI